MKLNNAYLRIAFFSALFVAFANGTAFAHTLDKRVISESYENEDHCQLSTLDGHVLNFEYENGYIFQLSYSKSTLVWTGLKGPDEGKSEQDQYQSSEVAPQMYMVSWLENDGTFVTTLINLRALKVFSSGVSQGKTWFWTGNVSVIK